jgi:hypothetical protein
MSNINNLVLESLTDPGTISHALAQAAVWGGGSALAAHMAHKASEPGKPKMLKPMTQREKTLHDLKKHAHRNVLKATALAGSVPGLLGAVV